MKITDILQKNCVRVPLASTDKTSVITELVDALRDSELLADRDAVLQAVLTREQTRSTGIGQGLAVPHGKSHGSRNLTMALGKPSTPLEFEAIDGQPCRLIVLLASPVDETGPHIQALARISRLWLNEDFKNAVSKADTSDDLYAAIEQFQG